MYTDEQHEQAHARAYERACIAHARDEWTRENAQAYALDYFEAYSEELAAIDRALAHQYDE